MTINNQTIKKSNPVDNIFESLKKSTASFEDFENNPGQDSAKSQEEGLIMSNQTSPEANAQTNSKETVTQSQSVEDQERPRSRRKKKELKTPRTFYLTAKTLKLLKKISYYTDRDYSDLINESIEDLSVKYK